MLALLDRGTAYSGNEHGRRAGSSSKGTGTSPVGTIELNTFETAPASKAPNTDVVASTFTLNLNLGLTGVSSPVTFTGSVAPVSGGNHDFTFNGTLYVWSADPKGSATFDVQTVGTCSSSLLGCYTVGIEPNPNQLIRQDNRSLGLRRTRKPHHSRAFQCGTHGIVKHRLVSVCRSPQAPCAT